MKTRLLFIAFILFMKIGLGQEVGQTAPDFTLMNTDNQEFTLSDHRGKVVAVFLFGYNCGSCRAIAPSVQSKIADAFKSNEDFLIVGVDTWNGSTAQVLGFKTDNRLSFDALQQGSTMANSWGTTYDRLVVVDQEGKMIFKGAGLAATHLDQAIESISSALKGTATALSRIENNKIDMLVFPNPAKNNVSVKFNLEKQTNVTISIVDVSGRKLIEIRENSFTNGTNEFSIDISDLNNGLYFVNIAANNENYTKRLVVR